MKNNKQKKGISLIVLIITIAVVIILAAAVILSMNNNRPIESAKTATEKNDIAVLKESAGVLSAQWEVDKLLDETVGTRVEYVQNGLTKQGFEPSMINKVTVDEKTGKVTVSGDMTEDVGSAPLVASDPQKYYGAYVTNYTATNASVVGWKILYSDAKNIYLIADDYIPYDAIPNSTKNGVKTANKPSKTESASGVAGPNAAYFTNILGDYEGSASITDKRLQNLNSKYYEYLKTNLKTSSNNNMKAVSYMMDTLAWKDYAGEKAEYAIGGPTLEMMVNSYNQKYTDASRKLSLIVEDGAGSEDALAIDGYAVAQGTEGWALIISWAFAKGVTGTGSTITVIYDSLYTIEDYSKAKAMWLGSPSGNGADNLLGVSCNASLANGVCSADSNYYDFGFRPLVCLKSSVILEEQSDGSYIIK